MSTMILFGDSHDEILLKEQEIVSIKRFEGCDVRVIDGKKTEAREVSRAFEVGLFDTDPILVVVYNASKVKNLRKLINESLDVLIVQYGSMLKSLEGLPCSEFKPARDRFKFATTFLTEKIVDGNRSISEGLAQAIVKRVGTDLGVLRWEALKFCFVGEGELQAKEVANLIAPLSEAENTELANALSSGSIRDFLRECDRIETTVSGDSFMKVKGLLSNQLMIMLEALVRLNSGESLELISREMKMKSFRLERYILPPAKRLGLNRIKNLLTLLADCEVSVFKNTLSPWTKFKAGALALLI
jgi:DNA polymerase III delta subunit